MRAQVDFCVFVSILLVIYLTLVKPPWSLLQAPFGYVWLVIFTSLAACLLINRTW